MARQFLPGAASVGKNYRFRADVMLLRLSRLKDGVACVDEECMLLFLGLLGFLLLFSLLALVKVSRSARDGFEDEAGFHYCGDVFGSTGASGRASETQSSHGRERTEHEQAA